MSKKPKRSKQKKVAIIPTYSRIDAWIRAANNLTMNEDYEGAVEIYKRLLNFLPRTVKRAEVLGYMGTAQAMLQNFPQCYEAFTEALSITPNEADYWYNRGLACRFTTRNVQSLRDYERAAELNKNEKLTKRINDELEFSRKMAEESMKLRGPNFTLDQLIEQEDHFQHGLKLMEAQKWAEAEETFRRTIEMGDCLPQPWGNLGGCLIMQERYDEAEAALKRALEIDPKYAIAKQNLKELPEMQRRGAPQMFEISDPFKGAKIKQSITFIQE